MKQQGICQACGYAWDSHGLGGNCLTLSTPNNTNSYGKPQKHQPAQAKVFGYTPGDYEEESHQAGRQGRKEIGRTRQKNRQLGW